MSKELTEKELSEELSRASAGTYGRRKQAYNQLEEIIEEHFSLRKKVEVLADEIGKRQQKLTVTREWIDDLAEACYEAHEMGATCKYVIEEAIKGLGGG